MTMRDLLVAMAERSASDLHITSGAAPTLRVHGHLVPLEYPALTPDQTKALAYSLITTEQRERFEAQTARLDRAFADLGLSEVTVKVHRGQVMRKMGAATLVELVRLADLIAGQERAIR